MFVQYKQHVFMAYFVIAMTGLIGLNRASVRPPKKINSIPLIDQISNSLKCHPNPGLAVAVVKDGHTVLSDGFGVSNLRSGAKATAKTKFEIASLTKPLTALLMLNKMALNGSVSLNTKVKDVIGGGFQFSDPWRTSEANIEDLLAHRLTMPDNSMFRFNPQIDRYEILRRMKFFKTNKEFRVRGSYSSTNYIMAAAMTELISGHQKWEELLLDTIFKPLGMTPAFAATVDYGADDVATPAIIQNGVPKEINTHFSKTWNSRCGSGCVLSSADDMALWMDFLLSEGKNNKGQQIFPASQVKTIFKPKSAMASSFLSIVDRPAFPVTLAADVYGLGWYIGRYNGYKAYIHTGDTPGYAAFIILLPDLKVGVFLALTGDDFGAQYRNALASFIIDTVTGHTPWLNSTTLCSFPFPWKPGKSRPLPTYAKNLKPARPVGEYIGVYRNDIYGDMAVEYNHTTSALQARYGIGLWQMFPQKVKDEFYGKGLAITDFFDINPFNFQGDARTGRIATLTVAGFNRDIPPVFTKLRIESELPIG